jgi:hypothetical protein
MHLLMGGRYLGFGGGECIGFRGGRVHRFQGGGCIGFRVGRVSQNLFTM